jgi:hypothetical protein
MNGGAVKSSVIVASNSETSSHTTTTTTSCLVHHHHTPVDDLALNVNNSTSSQSLNDLKLKFEQPAATSNNNNNKLLSVDSAASKINLPSCYSLSSNNFNSRSNSNKLQLHSSQLPTLHNTASSSSSHVE